MNKELILILIWFCAAVKLVYKDTKETAAFTYKNTDITVVNKTHVAH